jgi:hypothetical protein
MATQEQGCYADVRLRYPTRMRTAEHREAFRRRLGITIEMLPIMEEELQAAHDILTAARSS